MISKDRPRSVSDTPPPLLPHRLWRGHLSSVNSPGHHWLREECLECGLVVNGPVNQSFGSHCFQSLETKASWSTSYLCGVLLEPGLRNFYLKELWFWPPGQPVGDHPRPNISALTLSSGFIFWFVTSYWAYFAILTLTSARRNVCQFTNLSHPSQCLAHHYRVSLVYERFVFWEK